jgi:predicted DNA-binding mobile mystery protein A
MKHKEKAAPARNADLDSELEGKLASFRKVLDVERPEGGWIRAVREALDITNTQLAARLGMQPQSVADIQSAELGESIKIQTLRKLAEALGCKLVYAIVPEKPLKEVREGKIAGLAGEITRRLTEVAPSDAKNKKELERLLKRFIAKNPDVLRK